MKEQKVIGQTFIEWDGSSVLVDVLEDKTIKLPSGATAELDEQAEIINKEVAQERIAMAEKEAASEAKKSRRRDRAEKATVMLSENELFLKKQKDSKTRALILYALAMVLVFGLAKFFLQVPQKEISVVRLKADLRAGDILSEKDIEQFQMLQTEYDRLGTVTFKVEGKAISKQIIIPWDNRNKVVGKYMSNTTQAGQYITERHVTEKTVIRNMWLANVEPGKEIYTLPFQSSGVDTKLLFPGSHLRVRVISKVETEETDKVTETTGSEEQQSLGENNMNVGAGGDASGKENVVELVFSDLVAVDMLNASGESIFDIYTALLKIPLEERIAYLETTIENDTSKSFQTRVNPAALVFALSEEQATQMAQFENVTGYTIKYTILATEDENGDLTNSFVEISNQLNQVLKSKAEG